MEDPERLARSDAMSLAAGAAQAALAASAVTVVMAWPVLAAPATTIFGREIAGRHHDPFTVIQQFAAGGAAPPYQQPLTDAAGVVLARLVGAVPAYNALVLLSFPLTALTTYLLARYLLRSHAGALVAALAFAFAPVHLAQAAYHVHIAQTQWIPLYLLALIAAVDRPTAARMAFLVLAAAALVLSNAYGGLIGAVITPVALGARWSTADPRRWRGLLLPGATLAVAGAAGIGLVLLTMPELLRDPSRFAFPPADVARYGARWSSYLTPTIDHPLLGDVARRLVRLSDTGVGLFEQQVWLGWSWLVLAAVGLLSIRRPLLVIPIVGLWAILISLAPRAPACGAGSLVPSCLIHSVAPVFRAYARFGIVASACVALLAGQAVASGLRWRARPAATLWMARGAVIILLVCGAIEWWPLPGRARDILPTAGHRWLVDRHEPVRVLDCAVWSQADASLAWLMRRDVRLLGASEFERCDEPDLTGKLAALGFTHVLARTALPAAFAGPTAPEGLFMAASLADAVVYRVAAPPSPVVVTGMGGFHAWEGRGPNLSRWMGQGGAWTVMNTTDRERVVSLEVTLNAFAVPRHVVIEADGRPVFEVIVGVEARPHVIGPMTLTPGPHGLEFRSLEPATRPSEVDGSADRRPLTIRMHRWSWSSTPVR